MAASKKTASKSVTGAPTQEGAGGDNILDRDPNETPEERVERKAKEHAGPIAKGRKQAVKPNVRDLYPWAANRHKIERAHNYVAAKGKTEDRPRGDAALTDVEPETPEFEQAVMDHYTAHGGLVIGQEKVTMVGRKKLGKFRASTSAEKPDGSTTTEVVGNFDEEGGTNDPSDTKKEGDEDDE